MSEFDVRIIRGGRLQRLRLEAADLDSARRLALADGGKLVSLHAAGRLIPAKRKGKFALGLFIQELTVLLDAGLVLVESIETLRDKAPQGGTRKVLDDLLQAMYQGQAFSKAMALRPDVFPPLLVATAESSEHSGQLGIALKRYHHYEAHLDTVRKRLTSALIYPVVVVAIGGLILLFLLFFVIPRFASVFDSIGELPVAARFMVWWGGLVRVHGMLLGGAIAGTFIGLFVLLRTHWVRRRLMMVFWRIPRLSEIRELFVLARFYRTLGMLLSGGMSIIASLQMIGGLLPEERRSDLAAAMTGIKAGRLLSGALTLHHLTTPVAERLLRVGEQSGELPAMCERIAQFHDEALTRSLDLFSKVFEPILMLVVGGLVGLIVFLLYMPIFELAGSIQG
ncbi:MULTISPECIES: type II secretion system F family protein [Burkholderia]|uniref:General secretion pathway protein F n=1 Tax=Burkholderia pyrrocinia TaxID=60550 RepID=A0A318I5F5_BURPY|nr:MULTISPECIES: type II secretion system F family protein [Burkholderia]PXX25821.1 general secretion pathway protein F [Burkholderia pyrrocinia]SFW83652.1 general secretion pathway protein F [Burkholderia sp. NFACC33-1]SFY44800.1 general secretion pathway protein F [Burkholderia sp. NFPP32]